MLYKRGYVLFILFPFVISQIPTTNLEWKAYCEGAPCYGVWNSPLSSCYVYVKAGSNGSNWNLGAALVCSPNGGYGVCNYKPNYFTLGRLAVIPNLSAWQLIKNYTAKHQTTTPALIGLCQTNLDGINSSGMCLWVDQFSLVDRTESVNSLNAWVPPFPSSSLADECKVSDQNCAKLVLSDLTNLNGINAPNLAMANVSEMNAFICQYTANESVCLSFGGFWDNASVACYYFHPDLLSWNDARQFCINNKASFDNVTSGRLAVFYSKFSYLRFIANSSWISPMLAAEYVQISDIWIGLCSSKKYDFNSHHDCQWVDLPGIGSLTTFSFYDTNAMTDLYYAAGNICNKDPPLSCFAINPQQTLLTRHTTDEGFLDYLCEILPGNQTTTTTSTTTTTTTTSTSSSTTTTTQSTTASTASIQSLNGQTCDCQNGGHCILIGSTVSCECQGNWEGRICDIYGFPKDALGITSFVAQSIGCTVVIVLVSITVGCYLIVRDIRAQSVLILLSDISVLILHILIATCRSPFISGLSDFNCKIVSLAVQFFCLAHLSFLLIQALHAHMLTTGISMGGWWPLPAPVSITLALIIPISITGINGFLFFSQLSLKWTCLINYDSPLSRVFLMSAISLVVLTMILSESAAMKSRKLKLLLKVDRKDWFTAQFALRSTTIISTLSLLAILAISLAVHTISLPLFTIGFASNIAFASFLFFFHSIENVTIRNLLVRVWRYSKHKL